MYAFQLVVARFLSDFAHDYLQLYLFRLSMN
nr:MAG TPA: hypothetical protein [Caudoviricetes sp.]